MGARGGGTMLYADQARQAAIPGVPHDARETRAASRTDWIEATIDRVLVSHPRVRVSPRPRALLAASCRRVFPLRIAWQKRIVKDAERVRFVPIDAVNRQVLVSASSRRPRRVVPTGGLQVARRW